MHETKREWFKKTSFLGKFLYLTGCVKLYENGLSWGKQKLYDTKVRRIHPFTWIYALITLLVHGFNKKTIEDIREGSTWI